MGGQGSVSIFLVAHENFIGADVVRSDAKIGLEREATIFSFCQKLLHRLHFFSFAIFT